MKTLLPVIVTFLACWISPAQAAAPDLRATDLSTIDRTGTYNLGPTGMRGWIYHDWSVTAEQDATTAFAPYQILVTAVAANTPASGVVAVDDVILGASAGSGEVPLFTSDVCMHGRQARSD